MQAIFITKKGRRFNFKIPRGVDSWKFADIKSVPLTMELELDNIPKPAYNERVFVRYGEVHYVAWRIPLFVEDGAQITDEAIYLAMTRKFETPQKAFSAERRIGIR